MIVDLALPTAIYLVVLVLHRVLPARNVLGYVTDEHGPLRYRLNGLLVFLVVLAGWALACTRGLLAWDRFYVARLPMAAGACAIGIVVTLCFVVGVPRISIADFYLGRRLNPRAFGIDAKMYLYLAGATMLGLNLASFAAYHVLHHANDVSPGVLLHVALFGFFLVDYLFFEEVHLYTYDLFAERVGFKLAWGCLVFYPFFYACGLWSVAERPNPHTPHALLVIAAALFFLGWCLSRGANLQKFVFKRTPARETFGPLSQAFIEDDAHRLLVGGLWGLARHINYLGEVLMAVGLTVSLGYLASPGPWLYPLYYVALLVPRERDDDRRCAAKYGALWDRYRQLVPSRIVPRLY